MDQRQISEWQTLLTGAHDALRAASPGCIVHCAVLPSFADGESWEVIATPRSAPGRVTARHRQWSYEVDAAKVRTPVERLRHPAILAPTIHTREFELDPGELNALMANLDAAWVTPRQPSSSLNLDGTAYDLTFGWGATESRFRWCGRVPAGWQPLQDFVGALFEVLRTAGAQDDAEDGRRSTEDVG